MALLSHECMTALAIHVAIECIKIFIILFILWILNYMTYIKLYIVEQFYWMALDQKTQVAAGGH